MKPKKDLIKAAEADGSIDRLNSLLSAAHILNCEANMLVEEAADLMSAKGLLLGNLKRIHNSFVKSADMYFLEFSVSTSGQNYRLIGNLKNQKNE